MGNKKKNGGNNKPHQTRSFEQLVADATLIKFGGFIEQQINVMGRALAIRQAQQIAPIGLRLKALEAVLTAKLGITSLEIAELVSTYEDNAEGYQEVTEGGAKLGDRVRLQISSVDTTQADQPAPEVTRLMVSNLGAGQVLGQELETSVLDLTKGETRELVHGENGEFTTTIVVDRISRRPAPPQPVAAPAAPEAPAA